MPQMIPAHQTWGFWLFSSVLLAGMAFVVVGLFLNQLQIDSPGESAPSRRIQVLVTLLKQAEMKQASLERTLAGLKHQAGQSSLTALPSDIQSQTLAEMAGLTPVKGEGITITLYDAKPTEIAAASQAKADPNWGQIQADDVLKLVNELKASGAKAISINNQRLIATSEIVTAGQSILVNQARLQKPIVVKAIGPSQTLSGALKLPGGILAYLDFFSIDATIKPSKQLQVPAYQGSLPVH